MMLRKSLLAFSIYWCSLSGVDAAVVLSAGDHTLAPNTPGQVISISVTGMALDPNIVGANVNAQIPSGPVFNGTPDSLDAVNFGAGTIWDTIAVDVTGFAPVAGLPSVLTSSVIAKNLGDSVEPNGVLVKFSIDTTGVNSGVFDLLLENAVLGFTSNLILMGGAELQPVIQNGKITILPVPEPSAFALLGLVSVASFVAVQVGRRQRSRLRVPR